MPISLHIYRDSFENLLPFPNRIDPVSAWASKAPRVIARQRRTVLPPPLLESAANEQDRCRRKIPVGARTVLGVMGRSIGVRFISAANRQMAKITIPLTASQRLWTSGRRHQNVLSR